MESGAAPTISNIRLNVLGNALSKDIQIRKVAEAFSSTHNYRFTNCIKTELPVPISASGTTFVQLGGLEGMIAGGFLVLRTNTTGAAAHTFVSLASGSYDVVDGSSVTLIGGPKQAQYAQVWDWQRLFGNTIGSSQAIYPVAHAASLQAFMTQGVMTGFQFYDSQNRINITTDSTWTLGTYYVCYLTKQYSIVRIKNGKTSNVESS